MKFMVVCCAQVSPALITGGIVGGCASVEAPNANEALSVAYTRMAEAFADRDEDFIVTNERNGRLDVHHVQSGWHGWLSTGLPRLSEEREAAA